MTRARLYGAMKEYAKAQEDCRKAVELSSQNPANHNDIAWWLATCPDPKVRDPKQAVELAERAVKLASEQGTYWNTLGVARYRAGDWKGAVADLGKSMKLRKGGDAFDFFFLAMAHGQLGARDEAREWFDPGAAWMDKNRPGDSELREFRAEAAELLGILAPPPRPTLGAHSRSAVR